MYDYYFGLALRRFRRASHADKASQMRRFQRTLMGIAALLAVTACARVTSVRGIVRNPSPQQRYTITLTPAGDPGAFDSVQAHLSYACLDGRDLRGGGPEELPVELASQADGSYSGTVFLDALVDNPTGVQTRCHWTFGSVVGEVRSGAVTFFTEFVGPNIIRGIPSRRNFAKSDMHATGAARRPFGDFANPHALRLEDGSFTLTWTATSPELNAHHPGSQDQSVQLPAFSANPGPNANVSLAQGAIGVRADGHPIQVSGPVAVQGSTAVSPMVPINGSDSPYAAAGSVNKSAECLDKKRLTNKLDPVTLWRSSASCVSAGRYEEGIFIYGMAGAFTVFDAQRVADESAHAAGSAIAMLAFQSLPTDKEAEFKTRVKETFGNESKLSGYCKEIEKMGPPDYYPSYMIEYGLGAISAAHGGQPLVVPFDSRSAWPKAVKQYLRCP